MKHIYSLIQQFIALLFIIISLVLESCSNFNNIPIAVQKQATEERAASTKHADVKHIDIVGKEFTADGGHAITFYEVNGQLQASVEVNPLDEKDKVYNGVPVSIEKGTDLAILPRLDKKTQQGRILVQFEKGGKPTRIAIHQPGLMGGGNSITKRIQGKIKRKRQVPPISQPTTPIGQNLVHISSGQIVHPEGGGLNVQNGTRLVLGSAVAVNEDRVNFEFVNGNYLRHVRSGKFIHPEGGGLNVPNGTGLVLWDPVNEDRVQFEPVDGKYLRHVRSGKFITTEGGTYQNGTKLILSDQASDSRFILVEADFNIDDINSLNLQILKPKKIKRDAQEVDTNFSPIGNDRRLLNLANNVIGRWNDDSLRRGLEAGTLVEYWENESGSSSGTRRSDSRIDNQTTNGITWIGDGLRYYNIQLQIGSRSYAQVLVPVNVRVGAHTIRTALVRSMQEQRQIVIYHGSTLRRGNDSYARRVRISAHTPVNINNQIQARWYFFIPVIGQYFIARAANTSSSNVESHDEL